MPNEKGERKGNAAIANSIWPQHRTKRSDRSYGSAIRRLETMWIALSGSWRLPNRTEAATIAMRQWLVLFSD